MCRTKQVARCAVLQVCSSAGVQVCRCPPGVPVCTTRCQVCRRWCPGGGCPAGGVQQDVGVQQEVSRRRVSLVFAEAHKRVPGAFLFMILQDGGAQVIINMSRDDALQMHALLALWEFWVFVPVLRRDASFLTRRGLGVGGCGLLTVAESVPKQVALGHALIQLLQQQVPRVGREGGDKGKDGVLGAPVICA